MSTAEATVPVTDVAANPSPKPKHKVTLTRGAAFLLEGTLQHQKCLPDMHDSKRGSRLRRFLKEANPPSDGTIDFSKTVVFDRTTVDGASKKTVWDEAWQDWQDGTITIEFTDKQRDIARKALKVALGKRREEIGIFPENNDHTESLIDGFNLLEADDDESGD